MDYHLIKGYPDIRENSLKASEECCEAEVGWGWGPQGAWYQAPAPSRI